MVARGRAISCSGRSTKDLAVQETCIPDVNTEATSRLRLQDNEGLEMSPPTPYMECAQAVCLCRT